MDAYITEYIGLLIHDTDIDCEHYSYMVNTRKKKVSMTVSPADDYRAISIIENINKKYHVEFIHNPGSYYTMFIYDGYKLHLTILEPRQAVRVTVCEPAKSEVLVIE